MTGSVSDAAASMSLATFTVFERLTAKRSLVNLAFWSSGEGHSVVLELDDGVGSFTSHVVNGVLVTEPIGALDSVVHVVLPAVLFHVAEGGVDSSLSGDSVGSSWEELKNKRRITRVNSTLVMQAVWKPASERPKAARRPAPPAPMTSASNL